MYQYSTLLVFSISPVYLDIKVICYAKNVFSYTIWSQHSIKKAIAPLGYN
ncbi:hypothetical protein VB740_34675 [Nostoc sp. UHCC 0251]|nr:hypothetical protein [Nostoc sp. UHCC 0251]